jgi:hypothetical protein
MENWEYEAADRNENIEAVFIDICGFTKISETATAERWCYRTILT